MFQVEYAELVRAKCLTIPTALDCSHVVVVCHLQPSSSTNPGCPGPESSVPVSS